MIRISDALARAQAKKKNEEGFSLIELLVVVIIIGILAAIAIPIYIGVQNSAKDSAVKTDVSNAKTAVVAYYTDNGEYPDRPHRARRLRLHRAAGRQLRHHASPLSTYVAERRRLLHRGRLGDHIGVRRE